MAADLVVYAIVAAGLVLWLRNVLGTRHGAERERPSPIVLTADPEKPGALTVMENHPPTAEARIVTLAQNPTKILSIENKTAESGLLDIARSDRNFDINFFLDGAQEAYIMVIEAFAKGERETLRDLLADPVYKTFDDAITARESRREKSQTEIAALRKVQVTDASLKAGTAFITVRFHADETTQTFDENGNRIAGTPGKTHTMKDVWTFGRDIRGRDPRWLVYQTREDDIGDDSGAD
jgi:predicted lipid-binding transport protein (Tim44 family)